MSNVTNITFDYDGRFTVKLGRGDSASIKLQNMAAVSKADTFVVGQNNVAGGETDQSSGTAVEQHQYNIVSWDPNSDGMLNQHIEGGAFADTVIQEQGNDQQ